MSALRIAEHLDGPGPSRIPPHNLEAEESVLGACLLSRKAIADVLEVSAAEDFYKPAHREMFDIVLDLYSRGEPVDAVTVAEELRRLGRLEEFGGKPYFFTLVNSVPSPGSAAHYARIVAENAILRRLIDASQRISDLAFALPDDVEEAVGESENLLYRILRRSSGDGPRVVVDLLSPTIDRIEAMQRRDDAVTGVPTGFADLDHLMAGMAKGTLVVIAGRPGQGKSAMGLNIAQHVAGLGVGVAFFSMEMSSDEIMLRLLCSEARVDSNRARRAELGDADWPRISMAAGRLAEIPLHIDATPAISIMAMRARCRRIASQTGGLGLVVVDYLQLMTPSHRSQSRVQEVSDIARSLDLLTSEMNVPVIALCQLSRNVEQRADKRPMLSDLRESGEIEQVAHAVLGLYRDEKYNADSPQKGIAEVLVLKNRNGPEGKVELGYQDIFTRFTDLAPGFKSSAAYAADDGGYA